MTTHLQNGGKAAEGNAELPVSLPVEVLRSRLRDANGNVLADMRYANSWEVTREYIARAVNCHADLLQALKANNDLLFGLLDYFEPGHELSVMNAQREKNITLIAKAEGR